MTYDLRARCCGTGKPPALWNRFVIELVHVLANELAQTTVYSTLSRGCAGEIMGRRALQSWCRAELPSLAA